MLGDHGGHHRQEFLTLLEGIALGKGLVDAQGADHLAAGLDRHADKGALLVLLRFAGGGPVEKFRFLADAGNGNGLAGLDNPAGDPLTKLVFNAFDGRLGQTVGDLDVDFVAQGVEDGDGAPDHVHGVGKNIQNRIQGLAQIHVLVERLADFIEQGNFFNSFHNL